MIEVLTKHGCLEYLEPSHVSRIVAWDRHVGNSDGPWGVNVYSSHGANMLFTDGTEEEMKSLAREIRYKVEAANGKDG